MKYDIPTKRGTLYISNKCNLNVWLAFPFASYDLLGKSLQLSKG